MRLPRKAFSHLLLVVLALGGLQCPCPAGAAGEAVSHENHGIHHDSTADVDGCGHADCATDCVGVSADYVRQDAASPCTGKYPFDDIDALEIEIVVRSVHMAPVVRAGPPVRFSVAPDTPVRRFDRLLD